MRTCYLQAWSSREEPDARFVTQEGTLFRCNFQTKIPESDRKGLNVTPPHQLRDMNVDCERVVFVSKLGGG